MQGITRQSGPGIKIIEFEDRYLDETLIFLSRWNPEHPELGDKDRFLWQQCRRYLAIFQERIVGHIAVFSQDARSDGQPLRMGWAATLVVDTSNPVIQVFAGTALLDKVTTQSALNFGAVGIVPEIEDSHRRRGYVVRRDATSLYSRFFNPGPALRYLGKPRYWSVPIHVVNMIYRPSRVITNGRIEKVEDFHPAWDHIWEQLLAAQYGFYGVRTAAYLNHKISQPGKDYSCFVYTWPDGSREGYLVCRAAAHPLRNLRLLKICDLVGTLRAKQSLLSHANRLALEQGVDGLVALGSTRDANLLKKSGLWVSKKYPVVLPPGLPRDLYVSFFDSDLDDLW